MSERLTIPLLVSIIIALSSLELVDPLSLSLSPSLSSSTLSLTRLVIVIIVVVVLGRVLVLGVATLTVLRLARGE